MYSIIIFLPIIGSIVAGLGGRTIGVKGAQIITTSSISIRAILSLVAFYEVALCNRPVQIDFGSWIDSGLISINWAFRFDRLTVSILLAVLIVSALVHIFSIDYISGDPHQQRFFSYLSIFTFFIVILVTANNYLVIFVGWEFIGITSFLLIGFWYTRAQANKRAIKALVVNRVGDLFLRISFCIIFFTFGNIDYTSTFSIAPYVNDTFINFIATFLFIAAIGKRAQIFLHVWLADSIEGPTPVSALIHAATLVTAGVYLILRSRPLIEYRPTTLIIITFVGRITAFFAASSGLVQNDVKRVIAYSTCSQIGYLFIRCGLSQYNIALFHLVNHAFFKSLLFLSAGAILHGTNDQQDQRKLGGLIGFIPFTYTAIVIGSLSLIAFPFMTGFYSKDLIIEISYGQYLYSGQIAYYIGTISASFTAFYRFRLINITFLTYPNAQMKVYNNAHEASNIVIFVLTVLRILRIFGGYIGRDLFVGMARDFLGDSLFQIPGNRHIIEAEFGVNQFIKLLPIICTIVVTFIALYLYNIRTSFSDSIKTNKIYRFLNGQYLFNNVYNNYIYYKGLNFSYEIITNLDRGIVEVTGPYGLEKSMILSRNKISKLDHGSLTTYAAFMIIQIVAIIFICFQFRLLLFNGYQILRRVIIVIAISAIIQNVYRKK